MEIILLGTGGPKPDPRRSGPCLAVRIGSTVLLFDCGRGATLQLERAGISPCDVHSLFITHHHFDHIGGLGDFMLSGWNLGRKKTLPVFGPQGTCTIIDHLLNGVYAKDIAFRLKESTLSGVPLADIRRIVKPVEAVKPGVLFENKGIQVFCNFVRHGHGLGISGEDWQCLGYRIEAEDKSVTVSGDTVDCSGLDALAKNTHALVICCYLSGQELLDPEGELIGKHILACAPQVGSIATRAGAGKLILTHIREKHDNAMEQVVAEIRSAYDGEIIAGKDLMTIPV
ncbi:MAG: MBL fold metallo-hydrolase [Deltaproteobacteria bacterium]